MVSASAMLVLFAATLCTASANPRPVLYGHMNEHSALSISAPVRGRRVKPVSREVGSVGAESKNPNVERMASSVTTNKLGTMPEHEVPTFTEDSDSHEPKVVWKIEQAPKQAPIALTEDESAFPSWTFVFCVLGVTGLVLLSTKARAQSQKGGKSGLGKLQECAMVQEALAFMGALKPGFKPVCKIDENCDFGLPDEVHAPLDAETLDSSPVDCFLVGSSPEEPQPEDEPHLLDSLGLIEPESDGVGL